jgi:hypothetical protein
MANETKQLPELPPMPEPALLKTPDGEDYTDCVAHKWAWMAHGFDTGMEPFFSAEQVKALLLTAQREAWEAVKATADLGVLRSDANVKDGLRRYYMNSENGHMVETERGPWVRYVDVRALLAAATPNNH